MASPVVSLTCTFRTLFSNLKFVAMLACSLQLVACSSSKYISKQAKQGILNDSNFTAAHVGISIYDASANKYLYNYQGDKYFIPASNTKLFTCYAAMKHLGDSLVGLRYYILDSFGTKEQPTIIIKTTADPSFLHPDFKKHPVYSFLNSSKKWRMGFYNYLTFQSTPFGNGWAWNDYSEDYMAERNEFPITGNVIAIKTLPPSKRSSDYKNSTFRLFETSPKYFDSVVNHSALQILGIDNKADSPLLNYTILRDRNANVFNSKISKSTLPRQFQIPFAEAQKIWVTLLKDTLKASIEGLYDLRRRGKYWVIDNTIIPNLDTVQWKTIYSQPTDSLLKPMMHRSDNFFAEQTLLMISNEMTGVMNDEKIIDSLLKTDYKDLPQKPRWVDGSGLSRYNLFSPQDFITVLNKMKNDFSWKRITTILATGGEGTLSNYYINLKDRIFAKTGSLSNNLALSGFLITKKNKTLIFSVLVNNHMGNGTQIRKAVEKFLTSIAEKY